MNSYQHKSGAKKLKEKRERLERAERANVGQQTLFNVGMTLTSASHASVSALIESTDTNEEKIAAGEVSGNSEKDTSVEHKLTDINLENVGSHLEPLLAITEKAIELHASVNATVGDDSNTVNKLTSSRETKLESMHLGIDVGTLSEIQSVVEIENAVRQGPKKLPRTLPKDIENRSFPNSVFHQKLKNSESTLRDWLVWSQMKQALYCFPCRLFSKQPMSVRSRLATQEGYSSTSKWLKVYEKIPQHQESNSHKQ